MGKGWLKWMLGIGALLAAGLICLFLWRFYSKGEDEGLITAGDPYLITMQCMQTTEDPHNGLEIDQILYTLSRTDVLGKIVTVRQVDRKLEEYDPLTGEFRLVTDPADKLVELQIQAYGMREEESFTVGTTRLKVGQVIYPETDYSRISATIIAIEATEGDAE